jgi:hypothetical protein
MFNPGKPSKNGPFPMAMLNNQRPYIYIYRSQSFDQKLQNKSSHFGVFLSFLKQKKWQEPVDLNFFSFFAHLLVIFASSLLAWDGMG